MDRLLESYRRGSETGPGKESGANNRAVDQVHSIFKFLRTTDEGRAAILTLVSDDDSNVRLWAAAHSFFWALEAARGALQAIATEGGLLCFNATMGLREFDIGKVVL